MTCAGIRRLDRMSWLAGALALAAMESGCRGTPAVGPSGEEIFAVDPSDVSAIEFETPDGRVTARRTDGGSDRFEVSRSHGSALGETCAPAVPFRAAFEGLFSLRLDPALQGAAAQQIRALPSAVLRVRDRVQGEPAEWRVAVSVGAAAPPRLFLLGDDGVHTLKLAPDVVRHIAVGCGAF